MGSTLQQIYENNRQAEEIIEQLDTIFYNSSINNISLETSLKLARLDLQLMQTVENRIMRSGFDETQISLYSHSSESFAENVNNFIEYYQDYSGTEYDRGLGTGLGFRY